jgi:phosphotransferase system HPr (HPr) family protein
LSNSYRGEESLNPVKRNLVSMAKKSAKIVNGDGIHVRPATEIFSAIKDYEGEITLKANGEKTTISVMGMLMLGLAKGVKIAITVKGPDEEVVCKKLKIMFEKIYDFPPE